jgi:hypothetical protein
MSLLYEEVSRSVSFRMIPQNHAEAERRANRRASSFLLVVPYRGKPAFREGGGFPQRQWPYDPQIMRSQSEGQTDEVPHA